MQYVCNYCCLESWCTCLTVLTVFTFVTFLHVRNRYLASCVVLLFTSVSIKSLNDHRLHVRCLPQSWRTHSLWRRGTSRSCGRLCSMAPTCTRVRPWWSTRTAHAPSWAAPAWPSARPLPSSCSPLALAPREFPWKSWVMPPYLL